MITIKELRTMAKAQGIKVTKNGKYISKKQLMKTMGYSPKHGKGADQGGFIGALAAAVGVPLVASLLGLGMQDGGMIQGIAANVISQAISKLIGLGVVDGSGMNGGFINQVISDVVSNSIGKLIGLGSKKTTAV